MRDGLCLDTQTCGPGETPTGSAPACCSASGRQSWGLRCGQYRSGQMGLANGPHSASITPSQPGGAHQALVPSQAIADGSSAPGRSPEGVTSRRLPPGNRRPRKASACWQVGVLVAARRTAGSNSGEAQLNLRRPATTGRRTRPYGTLVRCRTWAWVIPAPPPPQQCTTGLKTGGTNGQGVPGTRAQTLK